MGLKQYIRDSIKTYLTIVKDALDLKSDATHNHNLNDLSEKDYDSLDNKPDLSDLHNHTNKTVLDKFGEDSDGKPTYNGNAVDTVVPQRDVYDGLDSDDNTISLSAKQGKVLNTKITDHVDDTSNPHGVTKDQVGLDQVDNTSDVDKPISTSVQNALDGKSDTSHNHNGVYIPVGGDETMNVDFATISLPNDGYIYTNTNNDERAMLRDNCLKLISKASDTDNKITFWVNAFDNATAIEILGKDNNGDVVTNTFKITKNGYVSIKHKDGSIHNEIPVISDGNMCQQDGTVVLEKPTFIFMEYVSYKPNDWYTGHNDREQVAQLNYHAQLPIDKDDFDDQTFYFRYTAQGFVTAERDDAEKKNGENYKIKTFTIPVKGLYRVYMDIDYYRHKMYTDDWFGLGITDRLTETDGSISHRLRSIQVMTDDYKTASGDDVKGQYRYTGENYWVLDEGVEFTPAIQSFDSGFIIQAQVKVELIERRT